MRPASSYLVLRLATAGLSVVAPGPAHAIAGNTAIAPEVISNFTPDGESISLYGNRPEVPLSDVLSERIPFASFKDTPGKVLNLYDPGLSNFFSGIITRSQNEHNEWQRLEVEAQKQISNYQKSGQGNPRLDSYIQFIETLRNSNLNPASKIEAVNAYVSSMISYQDARADSDEFGIKTTYEAVSSGFGVCRDMSHLKYVMLKAVGIPEANMRIVDGYLSAGIKGVDGVGHSVLVVNVNGYNAVLNSYSTDHLVTANNAYDRGVVHDVIFTMNGAKFYPLVSHSGGNAYAYQLRFGEAIIASPPEYRKGESTIPVEWKLENGNVLSIGLDTKACPDTSCKIGHDILAQIKNAHDLNPARQTNAAASSVKSPTARNVGRPSM